MKQHRKPSYQRARNMRRNNRAATRDQFGRKTGYADSYSYPTVAERAEQSKQA